MLYAAQLGYLDICKWLFKYGGDAKYQINKETGGGGFTPLRASYLAWHHGLDKERKTCQWLLRNGGGQHLSNKAMRYFIEVEGKEETNSNLLFLWTRENIQLYNTCILLLCGATTIITSSSSLSSSESSDGGTSKRDRKMHPKRSLQLLDGHPGIMELIADYSGLIRGTEFRMLKEFSESVIEYLNTDESSSDDDDHNNNGEDEDEE